MRRLPPALPTCPADPHHILPQAATLLHQYYARLRQRLKGGSGSGSSTGRAEVVEPVDEGPQAERSCLDRHPQCKAWVGKVCGWWAGRGESAVDWHGWVGGGLVCNSVLIWLDPSGWLGLGLPRAHCRAAACKCSQHGGPTGCLSTGARRSHLTAFLPQGAAASTCKICPGAQSCTGPHRIPSCCRCLRAG